MANNTVSPLAAEVFKRLKLRKMSQKELAEAIGCNYNSLRAFLNGNFDNTLIEQKVADYFEIER